MATITPSDPVHENFRREGKTIRESADSTAANTALTATFPGLKTPRKLTRILVTFHDGATPPVLQTATSIAITGTKVTAQDGTAVSDARFDIDFYSQTVTGKFVERLSDPDENFNANDTLKVVVGAPGAAIFSSVLVEWEI